MVAQALITGITGMVGSHLADFILANTDWDIIGLCRWRSPLDNIQHLLPHINRRERIQLIYGDLRDAVSMRDCIHRNHPDYVFHLAAQSFPRTSFDAPVETLDTNVTGTCNLLEAIRSSGLSPHIHVCSSSEVFGRVPKEKVPINEECTFHPASPYAISKVGTDLLGRYYAEAYGMKIMVTRMFTHTGPRRGDVFAESSFAKQIAMIEANMLPPVVKVGNLESLRTIADVRDAVNAYYLLVTVNPCPGEYYNIGGTYTCTIGDLLETLRAKSIVRNIAVAVDPDRLRPIDADLQVPDTRKFIDHTGWEPRYSYDQTMTDLLDYWRERVRGGNQFLSR